MKTLKELETQLLANPAIRAEYDAQREEFAAIRQDIASKDFHDNDGNDFHDNDRPHLL